MVAMVNHKKKYIFVHIPKTAGASIANKLKKDGSTRALSKVHPSVSELCRNYSTKRFFYFSFVRNPWDRVYSLYNFRKFKFYSMPQNRNREFRSFREFILKSNEKWHYIMNPRTPQTYWITLRNEIIPEFIGRFETLNSDLEILSSHINVSFDNLKHVHKTKRSTIYQNMYDDETKEFIEYYHKSDIEMFNYTF